MFSSCGKKIRTPISYELPKGYTGWVTVKYEKQNAPPLEKNDGRYLIKISKDGLAFLRVLQKHQHEWKKGGQKTNITGWTTAKK